MARKPEIQYIGQFYVYGSEAKKVEPVQKQKKAKTLPEAKPQVIREVALDPVAICGVLVAAAMVVVMILGAVHIQNSWDRYESARHYLTQVRVEHTALTHDYKSSYNVEEIRTVAQTMGLVPVEELTVIPMKVTVPAPKTEPTLWEDIRWFLEGLFA